MKNSKLVLVLIICIVSLNACKNKQDIVYGNEDGLLIRYSYTSMGEQFYTDVTNYNIEIYDNQSMNLIIHNPIAKNEQGPQEFIYEFTTDEDSINEILDIVSNSKLLRLEDIGSDRCDGYCSELNIYTPEEHVVGGYLASQKDYDEVVSRMISLIDLKYYLQLAQEEGRVEFL